MPCDRVTFEAAEDQFFANPLHRELNLISVLEQPLYGTVEQFGAFWCFGDVPIIFKQAAPAIGQHTDEIMRQLGFSDAEIADYRERKIIG